MSALTPVRALRGEPRFPVQTFLDRFGWTRSKLIKRLGWSHDSMARAEEIGGLPLGTADRLCCSLGLHPVEVWGELWWAFDEEEESR